MILLGKTAAECLAAEFKVGKISNNIYGLYHPSYYLRNNKTGEADFKNIYNDFYLDYLKEFEKQGKPEEVLKEFLASINATDVTDDSFILDNERWFINKRGFEHSNDIIIPESEADKYDNFLLVKLFENKILIPGWCNKTKLKSTPAKSSYLVFYDNLSDLKRFKLINKKLLDEFLINKQKADNLGSKEMISGVLSGLHYFADKSGIYFKDLNLNDEFALGDKKFKVFVRDIASDEDILIPDDYFINHPEIDYYCCCKIKAGNYWYVGYVDKAFVDNTRIVQMIGADSDKESDKIRGIFSDQYKPFSDFFKIYSEEQKEDKIIEQNYIPLHLHSEYSVGDAFGTPKYIAEALHKKGFKGAAITDHGTLGGVWEFQKALLEKNIKPIIGCELYVKLPEFKEDRFHLIALVKNKQGWLNLLKIQKNAVMDNFYYRPIVNIEDVFKFSEGLIITGACFDGVINNLINRKRKDLAENYIKRFKEVFKDDFYGEIQLHTAVKDNQRIMQEAIKFYNSFSVKSIFTTDSHYPFAEDKKYHEAIRAINFKKKFGEAGYGDDCFYLMTDDNITERINKNFENIWLVKEIGKLKENTFEIFNKCSFLIEAPPERDTLPKFCSINNFERFYEKNIKDGYEVWKKKVLSGEEKYLLTLAPEEEDENTDYTCKTWKSYSEEEIINIMKNKKEEELLLEYLCLEGLKKINRYDDIKYFRRLKHEFDRIVNKDYANYFLLVYDFVNWAKEQGIMVGPCRGSVGACLLALCLNIINMDPIKHDLLFLRFLSPIRKDFPDADLDFQDDRRKEVFDYLQKIYSFDNAVKVITYARFHPKGILRDIGRIFSISLYEIEKICDLCIVRGGGDARDSLALTDTFEGFEEAKKFKEKYSEASEIAMKLEGHIRHRGIHAAAMVVSGKSITEYAPIYRVGGEFAVEWEKQLTEDIHLIKFDILGLKTLTVISECIKDAGIKLPDTFDDRNIYEKVFHTGKTLGIFQFETTGLSKMSKSIKIDNFDQLSDVTTIYRPGALHCLDGNSQIYRKNGRIKLKELYNLQIKNKKLPKIYNGKGKLVVPEKIFKNGKKQLYKIQIDYWCNRFGGKIICATENHKFLTKKGWKKLKDLKEGDEIFILKREHPKWRWTEKQLKMIGRKPWNKGKKIKFSSESLKKISQNLIKGGIKTRFKKGNIPFNKGMKGWGKRLHKKYPESHPNYILGKNGHVSYKQKELFENIKIKYKNAKLNFMIKTKKAFRFADVAVPELKLDFEYDGKHWHDNEDAKKNDKRRDEELKKLGWKTIRIKEENFKKFKEDFINGIY